MGDWLDHLDDFGKWELFIPNVHIANIKYEASLPKQERSSTGFDNKFLISVFKSLDEDKYNQVLKIVAKNRKSRIMIQTNPRP